MKFGKTLLLHQIPEWLVHYMNYKHLKKIIKTLDSYINHHLYLLELPELVGGVLAQFFYELDRDIEKVSAFYSGKCAEYARRTDRLVLVLGYTNGKITLQAETTDELEEIVLISLELRTVFRNLKWFGESNHKGFVKILKKLDKKLVSLEALAQSVNEEISLETNNKETYLATRVEALPFANGAEVVVQLDKINDILNQLGAQQLELEDMDRDENVLKVGSNRKYSFEKESLEEYWDLIKEDRDKELVAKLDNPRLVHLLLNKAIAVGALKCVDALFSYGVETGFTDDLDISGRNFFHKHVLALGKKQTRDHKATPGQPDMRRLYGHAGPDGSQESLDGLFRVLQRMDALPELQLLIVATDAYHRTPLHYAAQHGAVPTVRLLCDYMKKWGVGERVLLDLVPVWGDQEGLTPLHLAVIGRHPKTTQTLLDYSGKRLATPLLLLLAARMNCAEIVRAFVSLRLVDVNYTDAESNYETALYIAAKLNYDDLVAFLLDNGADTELSERVFGWTPIFIAGAEGFASVVKRLIRSGANYSFTDDSGWLPMEHASLRGHLHIADLLKPTDALLLLFDIENPDKNTPRVSTRTSESALRSVDKLPKNHNIEVYRLIEEERPFSRLHSPVRRKMNPIKLFGHRYLNADELLVLVTLGTTDLRDTRKPISLDKISMSQSLFTELDTALSLVITCFHNKKMVESPVVVDLPLEDQHGSATDPITFTLCKQEARDCYITFDIVPTYLFPAQSNRPKGREKRVLGRGVAMLNSAYTLVGSKLRLLHNNINVPILETESMEVLGQLNFEYLCVNAFTHPQMSITRSDTYWKQLVSTRVIGHRGLGKNVSNRTSLQLGENTVELFIAAASLGALYVEFDVQLTKDYVPVIYHDFLVAESGVDIPMHALTSEQFLGLNETKHKPETRPRLMSSYPSAPNFKNQEDEQLEREFRDQVSRRMKLTKTWKEKGFKGNARGLSVASNFVTLKELFRRLPSNIGFNMELKYPMLDEAESESMGEVAFDMNFYVDTILKVVYDENNGRDILFSSFHPDICLLLSLKQPTMPILFLTEGGSQPMADIRALLLQNAIRFAKKWNLLGIVLAATTLVKTPRLAQVVKSSGLVCVTYGIENNSPELCKIQMKAGVDAVIADSVLAVRKSLREPHLLKEEPVEDEPRGREAERSDIQWISGEHSAVESLKRALGEPRETHVGLLKKALGFEL